MSRVPRRYISQLSNISTGNCIPSLRDRLRLKLLFANPMAESASTRSFEAWETLTGHRFAGQPFTRDFVRLYS